LLARLFADLCKQDTKSLFSYSIVVADNDEQRTAEPVVQEFAKSSGIRIEYCVESRQSIALARNRAIEYASGDLVAFIDDDEFPTKRWLLTLFEALEKYNVDGVLGPVKPYYEQNPPAWVIQAKFYDRPSYPTGFVIDWRKGRTGNVLLKKELFEECAQAFRSEFRTGEDQDFFRRMIEKGHTFVWCEEALAYEVVPPIRWNRMFMIKRALLRGATVVVHPTFRTIDAIKSILAIPAYAAALPFALAISQWWFMLCLIKLFDHLGLVLALLGITLVRDPYVTG
jgi:cellulose synthase/poly-beta-1,6-N-acetylglucosamine synthase-like glycosyltransferase